ncbi:hypothetical protein RX327_32930 [Bradyrhizobium sp. BEA-2-5]|uniref:hypothetical protein n=1 Tax=Bradyrhizobium sp. BEA-2-5 TaxID=3080015 RepID=UPI00293F5371|nr:hypothetical protein [Bradyrhizobium sp. BEA-2-5]WOH80527.1 hypothetical protein RX327_32930 [Bradyrhizobium sp. BEA-2-5]
MKAYECRAVDVATPNYPDMHKVVFDFVEISSARQKNLMANVHIFANRRPWTYNALVDKPFRTNVDTQ